ncbi:MAG: heme exporter protein CcmD [Actinomycetota bacterium]
MSDLGFIVLSYAVTAGSIISLAIVTIHRGRLLARQVADRDKPWI